MTYWMAQKEGGFKNVSLFELDLIRMPFILFPIYMAEYAAIYHFEKF